MNLYLVLFVHTFRPNYHMVVDRQSHPSQERIDTCNFWHQALHSSNTKFSASSFYPKFKSKGDYYLLVILDSWTWNLLLLSELPLEGSVWTIHDFEKLTLSKSISFISSKSSWQLFKLLTKELTSKGQLQFPSGQSTHKPSSHQPWPVLQSLHGIPFRNGLRPIPKGIIPLLPGGLLIFIWSLSLKSYP